MSRNDLWIDVKMPYAEGKKLAYAYNRAMESTTAEWVLFLDQDLFICNKRWYEMSIRAIRQVGHDAGWITAVTNRIGNPGQRAPNAPATHDLVEHIAYAKHMYETFGDQVVRFRGALCGFFILTSKTAWKKAGGFNEGRTGLNGVDNDYSRAVQRAGYTLYGMPGLYFYHMWREKNRLMKW